MPAAPQPAGQQPTAATSPSGSQMVKIAANLPLTGNLSTYGAAVKDGATMALEDLSKKDPNGPHLTVDWQDNAGNAKTTVTIMQRQFIDPPDIYMSGVKPQSMAIREQIQAKGTPHFEWVFDTFINRASEGHAASENNLRCWVNFKIEPAIFLKYVDEHKSKRVAIVYVRLPSTQEEYESAIVPALNRMGIKHILVEPYEVGSKDYKTLALKVKDFKPDLTILSGFQDDLVGLLRAFRPLGLIGNGNTISTYDMLDAGKILGKDEIEGIRFSAPKFVTRAEEEKVKQWTDRFKKRFGRKPLYSEAYGYDSIVIINDAAKRLHLPATAKQWLAAIRATSCDGVTGCLLFDDDGTVKTPVEMAVFRNGKAVPDQP